MTDVFLSYSRANQKFAHEVVDYLNAQDISVWVDWNDIQISEDWMSAIFEGIQSADNVVFVISPDSAISTVCHIELAYARRHSKRLIPIVYKEVDKKSSLVEVASHLPDELEQHFLGEKSFLEVASDNWPAIQRHNWLFFEERADPVKLQQLVNSLHADLKYVKTHTRLGKQAKEWDDNNRNRSFMLRGENLKQAEVWLRDSGGKYPEPSALMTAFIVDSRRKARTRLQQMLVASITAAVIMLILMIVSLILFDVARRNAAEANSLARASRAQTALRTGDADLALALALAANEDDTSPREAQQTLFEMALAPGTRSRVEYEFPLIALEWNPTEDEAVALRQDGAILRWPVQQPNDVTEAFVPTSEAHAAAIDSAMQVGVIADCVEASGDGACEQYQLRIVSMDFARVINEITLEAHRIAALEFDETGSNLAIVGCAVLVAGRCEEGLLAYIKDVTTQHPLILIPDDYLFIETLSIEIWLDTFDTWLISGSAEGKLETWRVEPDRLSYERELGDVRAAIQSIAIDRELEMLAYGDDGGIIRLGPLNSFTSEPPTQLIGHTSAVFDLYWLPGDRYLVSGSADSSIILWDTHRDDIIGVFNGHTASVRAVRANADTLISASTDGTVRTGDMQHQATLSRFTENNSRLHVVAVSPTGEFALYGTHDLGVKLWPRDPTIPVTCPDSVSATTNGFSPNRYIWDIVFSKSGDTVWFSGQGANGNKISRWNLETCEIEAELTGHTLPVQTIALSNDEQVLLSGSWSFPEDDYELFVWNLASGDIIHELSGHSNGIDDVDFSLDGQLTLSASHDGTVIVWRTAGWTPLLTFAGHGARVTVAQFTPDSQSVLSGDSVGTLLLWDARSGELVRRLRGHTDSILALDISPDGRYAISGGDDRSVRFWDLASGVEIQRAVAHYDTVSGLDFNPDATQFVSSSFDSSIIWWDAPAFFQSVSQIRTWTKENRYITSFTCDERWLYDIKPLCD